MADIPFQFLLEKVFHSFNMNLIIFIDLLDMSLKHDNWNIFSFKTNNKNGHVMNKREMYLMLKFFYIK